MPKKDQIIAGPNEELWIGVSAATKNKIWVHLRLTTYDQFGRSTGFKMFRLDGDYVPAIFQEINRRIEVARAERRLKEERTKKRLEETRCKFCSK